MADISLAQDRRSGIYEIVNTVNGKRYVGSAVNFLHRWKVHLIQLRRRSHHSRYLQASWTKHGENSFEFRVLLVCNRENLLMYEQAAIDALNPEFNICRVAGSALGVKHTAETRAKQSAAKMGNTATLGHKHRPEAIAKLRAKQLGVPSPTKGKRRDPDAVAATAAAHRGMKRSAETCAKIAMKARGRVRGPRSAEHSANLAAAQRGKQKSPEHMAALQAGRATRIYTESDRANIRAKSAAMWADPQRRALILERQRIAREKRLS